MFVFLYIFFKIVVRYNLENIVHQLIKNTFLDKYDLGNMISSTRLKGFFQFDITFNTYFINLLTLLFLVKYFLENEWSSACFT